MVTTVSFPGLGLEFELNRVAFSIGGFNVYWYGLLIGIGFMLAGTYALLNARKVGVDSDRLIDVVMVGLVCGVIGARLYYVIFDWETFQGDLSKIFDIRQGGLAIYGGILAGMAGGIIMAKIRKVRVRPAMDLAAAGFLIGQGIGRWGNFVNVEAFGSNTNSILGMTGPKVVGYLTQVKNSGAAWAQSIDPHMPVHPTFLYESVWCLTGFLIIALWLMRRRKYDGQVFLFLHRLVWPGTVLHRRPAHRQPDVGPGTGIPGAGSGGLCDSDCPAHLAGPEEEKAGGGLPAPVYQYTGGTGGSSRDLLSEGAVAGDPYRAAGRTAREAL